jgi:hypothetical protein
MASATDSLAIDTVGREPEPAPCYDNFYSPENRTFYTQKPYQPLSTSHRQLRLLKLLSPSISGEHPLSFQLLDQVPLEAAQKTYTALSYCAGDPNKTAPILVNGIAFNAFANLELALQEAVVYWKEKDLDWEKDYLWADQICINQSNTVERSHQVGMMRDIYAGAARVLICLDVCGSESEGSVGVQWAIDQLSDVKQQLSLGRSTALEEEVRIWPEDDIIDKVWTWTRKGNVTLPRQEDIDLQGFQQGIIAFLELILRPWWSRAWICQEFIFAAEADFASGGVSMPWQAFHWILEFYYFDFYTFRDSLLEYRQEHDNICSRSTITYLKTKYGGQLGSRIAAASNLFRQKAGWTGPRDIKVWLKHAKSCETSDPRDKIFAFLGLAYPGYDIKPDYSPSKSLDVLLIEITSRILNFEKSFAFLFFIKGRNEEITRGYANGGSLPSWIPDWTARHDISISLDRQWAKAQYFSQFPPSVMPGGILKLEGFKLDIFRGIQERGDYTNTRKGLLLHPSRYESRSDDSLWYFPAAGFDVLIVLRPNSDYFRFIDVLDLVADVGVDYRTYGDTSDISRQLKDFATSFLSTWSKRCWVAKMVRLVQTKNHADLIKMKGVKGEIVYIR